VPAAPGCSWVVQPSAISWLLSKRDPGQQISPILGTIVRPNQNQRFGDFNDWRTLRDYEQNAGAVTALRLKLCKRTRHGAFVMSDQNSILSGSQSEHILVGYSVQFGGLGCLKVDSRLPPKCGIDDDSFQIIIGLKPNTQEDVSSWRAARNRAKTSGRLWLKGGKRRSSSCSPARMLASTSVWFAR
jgi:hypothetical protein